jgi:hypothetical protein
MVYIRKLDLLQLLQAAQRITCEWVDDHARPSEHQISADETSRDPSSAFSRSSTSNAQGRTVAATSAAIGIYRSAAGARSNYRTIFKSKAIGHSLVGYLATMHIQTCAQVGIFDHSIKPIASQSKTKR